MNDLQLLCQTILLIAAATTNYLNSDGSVKETMTTGYVYDNAGRLDSLTYTIGSTTMIGVLHNLKSG